MKLHGLHFNGTKVKKKFEDFLKIEKLVEVIFCREFIETSILKEVKQDRVNDSNISEIRRFYGAIDYENEIYPVKITVKVIKHGKNKAYSYEVMQIESPITYKKLSGQSILGGVHGDRIHPTDDKIKS